MNSLFHLLLFDPLYNLLVWFSSFLPAYSLGWSIVILTILVRLILFPFQHRAAKTQNKLLHLNQETQKIKERFAEDRAEQARQIMALYRAHGVNPFASFLFLLIQLPILLALFYVFNGSFELKPELLYSFVIPPPELNLHFLGLINLSQRSWLMAMAAALTQFVQAQLVVQPPPPEAKPSFQQELTRSLSLQSRYFLPVLIGFIAWGLPAATALYWTVNNLFVIGHELAVNLRAKKLVSDLRPTD